MHFAAAGVFFCARIAAHIVGQDKRQLASGAHVESARHSASTFGWQVFARQLLHAVSGC
jgi:hypothetical protein